MEKEKESPRSATMMTFFVERLLILKTFAALAVIASSLEVDISTTLRTDTTGDINGVVPLAPNVSLYSSVEALSWSPRVSYFPHFLSDEECDFLIERASADRQFDDSKDFNSIYVSEHERLHHPLISRIEQRMAAVTGSPIHRYEEPLCVHRILPSTQSLNIRQIHHDKVNKEFSSITILVYLEEVEKGGETIWPCNSVDANGVPLRDTCKKVFDAGVRWHSPDRTVTTRKRHWRGVQQEKPEEHGVTEELGVLLQMSSDVCGEEEEVEVEVEVGGEEGGVPRITANSDSSSSSSSERGGGGGSSESASAVAPGASTTSSVTTSTTASTTGAKKQRKRSDRRSGGVQGGLKVTPQKGAAVVFHHDLMNGQGDPWAWHTGCEVRRGVKWTLQKFKELPVAFRNNNDNN